MSDVLGQALAYAAAGWPVFPCKPDQKTPDTAHGFKDATTDPAIIRRWWPFGDRNVAIATGAPGPDVLDVDVRPEGTGWAAFNLLKRAGLLTGAQALVRTPSGGLHAYYQGSSQGCGRLARQFVDFKAAGGYVLAPPSRVHGRPYELLDHREGTASLDWAAVRKLLDPRQARRPRAGNGSITALVEWGARAQPGDRNHPLYWAAKQAALAGLLDAEAVERFTDAALRAGIRGGEAEARRTVASAARKWAAG